jgi:hypothetical protein
LAGRAGIQATSRQWLAEAVTSMPPRAPLIDLAAGSISGGMPSWFSATGCFAMPYVRLANIAD